MRIWDASTSVQQPRATSGEWETRKFNYPEIRLDSTPEEERTAVWEAEYASWSEPAAHAAELSRVELLRRAMGEDLSEAAAAQASALITANDLSTLLSRRLVVDAGFLANPNVGGLDFTVQMDLALNAFPEHRLIAARNRSFHLEVLDALAADDDDAEVRQAARETVESLLADTPSPAPKADRFHLAA